MEFYPPLNIDSVFDKSVNDKAIAKFGFSLINDQIDYHNSLFNNNNNTNQNNYNTNLLKSKSINYVEMKNYHPVINKLYNYSSINLNRYNNLVNNKIRNTSTPSSVRLLRKLGQNERIFHGQSDLNRSYIYRTVIITSEIDLYNNLNVVYKAIEEWKSIHPLLRVRVVTKQDGLNGIPNSAKEKYFAFATDAKIKSMDNLEFLYYNSNCAKQCEDIWKLLVERETTLPLDGADGLLWRLTFFQIKNFYKGENSVPLYLYAVILTFDHSIMDGRSSYTSLLQLFSIIEDTYNQSFKKQKENPLLPSKEDIYKVRRSEPQPNPTTFNYFPAPEFLDIENAFRNSYIRLKYLSNEEEKYGMILNHDHTPFISVKELVDLSKMNNSKFRTLIINKNDLNKIIKKCKENNVKLTTFLNMCIIVAIRMIYERYEADYFLKDEPIINYTTNISLREFPEYQSYNPEKNSSIGCYIGLSLNSFKDSIDLENPNWISEFWKISSQESSDFHEKLNKGEFVHSIHLPNRKKEKHEFFYHFGNSNLGILPSYSSSQKLIRVKQTFATGKYSKDNFLCWFSNLIATVDQQLCWTISYNTFFIKQEIITLLVENLTKVIKELIK